jgi:hypothetical protein
MYYWHVAAYKNDDTQPQFSETRWFMISSAPNSVNEESPILINSLAPNPAAGSVYVRFSTNVVADVRAELFDARGNSIARVYSDRVEAGDHGFTLNFSDGNLSSLASGTYYLRFTSGASSYTRPVVLTR